MVYMAYEDSRSRAQEEDIQYKKLDRTVALQSEEEDKTVRHMLPNIQDKNNREMDKGMDSLKLTASDDCRKG